MIFKNFPPPPPPPLYLYMSLTELDTKIWEAVSWTEARRGRGNKIARAVSLNCSLERDTILELAGAHSVLRKE